MKFNRRCFREPIQEIFQAAKMLEESLIEYRKTNISGAKELIIDANMPVIREWTESIWGSKSPYIQYRNVDHSPPLLKKEFRLESRMPNLEIKKQVIERDGYHCRFCGIPLIRMEVRKAFVILFSDILIWGRKNNDRHAAFMTMWLQYDHILPHSRGGTNDIENLIISCAPCNFGRMSYTLDEVGLQDPRLNSKIQSSWNGLERIFIDHEIK